MKPARPRFPLAMIARAGWFQFDKNQKLSQRHLEACSLIWCKAGQGNLTINGRLYPLEQNHYVFAPWRHHIEYHAKAVSPYFVAAVHLIPQQRRGVPVQFNVAHDKYRVGYDVPERRGLPVPALLESFAGNFAEQPALGFLAEYILESFTREEPEEEPMRELGRRMADEIYRIHSGAAAQPAPSDLQRLELFIRHHLDLKLDLDELVAFSHLSSSTIQRLFLKHRGISPRQWILREKVAMAKNLLRSSHFSLREVAEKIGIDDPYYFSRFFRHHAGETASRFRRRSSSF